jgi:hypothetical protein
VRITSRADVVVDRPISRKTIRSVSTGFLVSCGDARCDWQGLFPTAAMAAEAVARHVTHARRSGEWHYGEQSSIVVELIDRSSAVVDGRSRIDPLRPDLRKYDPEATHATGEPPVFPRSSTGRTVADLVERGDRIRLPPSRDQKVARVTPTRSLGLPTWSVRYCDLDHTLTHDTLPPRGQNELVARDGAVYRRYGEDYLGPPAFEIVGVADHQASIGRFAEP